MAAASAPTASSLGRGGSRPQMGTRRRAGALCLPVGVINPRNRAPVSDPRPESPHPGIQTTLSRGPVAARREGAGLRFGARGAGETVRGGAGRGTPASETCHPRAGGDGEKPGAEATESGHVFRDPGARRPAARVGPAAPRPPPGLLP